jgi:hypothetical protein
LEELLEREEEQKEVNDMWKNGQKVKRSKVKKGPKYAAAFYSNKSASRRKKYRSN